MAGSETFINEKGQYETRKTSSAEDVASAQDKERLQSAAGLGSKEKTGSSPAPKLSDYKGDMGAYMKAMREYRQREDESRDAKVIRRGTEMMGSK